jgi:hypothetical protein
LPLSGGHANFWPSLIFRTNLQYVLIFFDVKGLHMTLTIVRYQCRLNAYGPDWRGVPPMQARLRIKHMPPSASLTLLQRQAASEKSYHLLGLTKTRSKGDFGEGAVMHYFGQLSKRN